MQDACTIHYSAIYQLGWYAVTVQVEDFNYNISPKRLSSVPVQFLVSVENNTANCLVYEKEKPKFVGLTLPDKACVGVINSTDFTTDIYIQSGSHSRLENSILD